MIARARAAALFAVLLALLGPALACAAEGGPVDPIARVVLHLAVILVAAKLGGEVAMRLGQPSVLGELVVGVVLGNLGLLGYPALDAMKDDAALDVLARLGVVILLFQVGLESTVRQMLQVGL